MSQVKTVGKGAPGFVQRLGLAWAAFRGNLTEPPPWLLSLLGAPTSAAGVDVVPETAITLSVVWDCAQILAQSVGVLPLQIYEDQGPTKGKRRATDHPLWDVLHFAPNPEQTSMIWRMVVMAHLALWGNHYSQIVRDRLGRPIQLWPIHPQRVRAMRSIKSKRLYYVVAPMFGETGTVNLDMADMLHVKGLSMTGLVGLSPIGAAREAIGSGLAAQEYGARFFSNDATPGGVLEHPAALGDVAYKRLKESIENQTRGLRDKHRMIILEEGMKWSQIGMKPEDAQFLATRDFNVRDIARFYRMPLYKLSEPLTGKSSNVEQMSIEFVTDTLLPWLVNIEQEIMLKLFSAEERQRFFPEFLVDGLLRGDMKTRYESYALGRQWGWMSANEVRHAEHMNPVEGGDVFLVPMNMQDTKYPLRPTNGLPKQGKEGGSGEPVEPEPSRGLPRGLQALAGGAPREAPHGS